MIERFLQISQQSSPSLKTVILKSLFSVITKNEKSCKNWYISWNLVGLKWFKSIVFSLKCCLDTHSYIRFKISPSDFIFVEKIGVNHALRLCFPSRVIYPSYRNIPEDFLCVQEAEWMRILTGLIPKGVCFFDKMFAFLNLRVESTLACG